MTQVLSEVVEPQSEKKKNTKVLEERLLDTPYEADEQPRKDEEKNLFEKINEIRKALTVKEDNKNYENLLKNLSETKSVTDSFFDNVVVNDENKDIKNNRIELLKMFCNTFNNFINFSKLEGL